MGVSIDSTSQEMVADCSRCVDDLYQCRALGHEGEGRKLTQMIIDIGRMLVNTVSFT